MRKTSLKSSRNAQHRNTGSLHAPDKTFLQHNPTTAVLQGARSEARNIKLYCNKTADCKVIFQQTNKIPNMAPPSAPYQLKMKKSDAQIVNNNQSQASSKILFTIQRRKFPSDGSVCERYHPYEGSFNFQRFDIRMQNVSCFNLHIVKFICLKIKCIFRSINE